MLTGTLQLLNIAIQFVAKQKQTFTNMAIFTNNLQLNKIKTNLDTHVQLLIDLENNLIQILPAKGTEKQILAQT